MKISLLFIYALKKKIKIKKKFIGAIHAIMDKVYRTRDKYSYM